MKDLDKTQVYDLRGITEEQARELHEWLKANDKVWIYMDCRWLKDKYSLINLCNKWRLSENKPTTHISTLFEKSYEQQLQEAKKQLEHYKKEVERLENGNSPKTNDVVKAWNNVGDDFVIGILTNMRGGYYPYEVGRADWFKNAKKLTDKEVIDLLFKKS